MQRPENSDRDGTKCPCDQERHRSQNFRVTLLLPAAQTQEARDCTLKSFRQEIPGDLPLVGRLASKGFAKNEGK